MGAFVGISICVVLVALGIFFSVVTKIDRWSPKKGELLSEDAEVTNIDVKRYNKHYFKAVIDFSDEFRYITYVKPRQESAGILTTKLIVDVEMQEKLIDKAICKHIELIRASRNK